MNKPKVFADFHNADRQGRLRLNCIGTIEDLAQQQIVLRDGVCLTLYSEELDVEGSSDIPQTNTCGWPSLTARDQRHRASNQCSRRRNVTAALHRLTLLCTDR